MIKHLLLKAGYGPPPAGSRWITVHPHGDSAPGQPVLVVPHPTHKGAYRVIGGAGGKLNYMKLRGVKPEGSYKQDLSEREKARRTEAKRRKDRDRESGIARPKAEKKLALAEERREARREFVARVATAAGWDRKSVEFDAEAHAHLSPEAYRKAQREHQSVTLRKAREFVQMKREEILADPEKKAEAYRAIPLNPPPDPRALSVADLNTVRPNDAGLGLSHDFVERAGERAGGTEALKDEIETLREKPRDPEREAERNETAERIKKELVGLRPPAADLPTDAALRVQDTMALLSEEKALRIHEREIKKKLVKLDRESDIKEIEAYNVGATPLPDPGSVVEDLENLARTDQTVSFLKMVEAAGEGVPPEQAMYRHIAAGASNALSAVGLTVAGQALVDRSVVDVLGVSGAARVVARQLHASLDPARLDEVREALDAYHVDHYTRAAKDAMERAQTWLDVADRTQEMDPRAETGDDLALIDSLHRQRIEALAEARKIVGTALGEFEMGAALNWAMREGRSNQTLQVSLGGISPAAAYTQLRALGLEPHDFQVSSIDGEQIAEVTPDGLDRVARPVDRETIQRQRTALDIIEGRKDEQDWLPQGFARREDLNGIAEPGQAPKLARPFDASEGLQQGIKEFFGGRVADGDNPRDIIADAISQPFLEAHVPEGQREDYLAAVAELLPTTRRRKALAEGTGGQGKMVTENVPIETYRETLDGWADEFTKKHYGEERTAFSRQDFPMDDTATEAMHRALSSVPEGAAAFKAIGDMTDRDQRALRVFFDKHVARDEDDENQALRQEISALARKEPAKEAEDMFGETSDNPDWAAWRQTLDQKGAALGERALTWKKYVQVMDGRENAYAALQDLIRSKVCERFSEAYNGLRPDAPLAVGRQAIREHRRHLDALDPKARATRLQELARETAELHRGEGGKFAEGKVKEEREERRAAKEGFEQAQMGMFGMPEPENKPLAANERHSLGHVAEQRLAGLANLVGAQFRPGQPIELRATRMSDRYINQQRAIKLIEANQRVALAQGTGCVHGTTRLTCETTQKTKTFEEWCLGGERLTVKALSRDGKIIVAEAEPVFIKGYDEMFDVRVGDTKITVTAKHLFLTPDGWKEVGDLIVGDLILADFSETRHQELGVEQRRGGLPHAASLQSTEHGMLLRPPQEPPEQSSAYLHQSIEELCLSTHREGGLRSWHKEPGSQDRYSVDSRPYDEQPLDGIIDALAFETLPSDAREHNRHNWRKGGLEAKEGHTHLYLKSSPHSMLDSCCRQKRQPGDVGCDVLSCTNEPFHPHNLAVWQSPPCLTLDPHKGPAPEWGRDDETDARVSFYRPRLIERHSLPSDGLRRFAERSPQWTRTHQTPQEFPDNCISWEPIQSITSSGHSLVYDIRVPVCDCYFAEGVLNHNSGKTGIGLGAFTHLHAQGKVKRGIFAVPSIVQGQFGAEALRFLDPSKGYKWHAEPGASREQRIAALKDPGNHFVVTTHQALRDDLLHLGAQREKTDAATLATRLDAMTPSARTEWMRGLMESEGIDCDYLNVDEGHNLLNRAGKTNSHMANVFDALSSNTPYYVNATADPVKNDVSEAFDLLAKMSPGKYQDRDEFMRRYGPNTSAAREGLRREMLSHLYPGRIDPGVATNKRQEKVAMSPEQTGAIQSVESAAAKVRLGRMQGKTDVAACRALAPEMFADADPKTHEKIAAVVARNVGVIKNTAVLRAINSAPNGAKVAKVSELAGARKGQPGVIFAHHLKSVALLKERLEADGHRVAVLTGADSSKRKDQVKRAFNPEGDVDAEADILIASDAGAVGMNAQRGRWLIQYDVPDTAMVHAQRNGRIHRLGQRNDVELIDLATDHPTEHAARKRLVEKYDLRDILTSPYEGLDDTGLAHFLTKTGERDER
jgi:hypothetical protein